MNKTWLATFTMIAVGCATAAPPAQNPSDNAPAPVASAQAPVASAEPTAGAAPEVPTTAESPLAALGEGVHHHALVQKQLGFYAVLTPPGYDAPENKSKRYPIVVILHGSGSDELRHGKLAKDLGRDGVIYVLPRAPYPHGEAFASQNQPGWTAWPDYPEQWGQWQSESFPTEEIKRLKVSQIYIDRIAESLTDARKRYRAKADKIVVVGHSQGAAFAHLFATRYPWLVKAYFAYAGYYDETTADKEGVAALSGLKSNQVLPMLVHYEGDSVVKAEQTQKLDELLTARKINHITRLLPAGSHEITPEVKLEAKAFVREWCCGEKPAAAAPAEAPAAPAVAPEPAAPGVAVSTPAPAAAPPAAPLTKPVNPPAVVPAAPPADKPATQKPPAAEKPTVPTAVAAKTPATPASKTAEAAPVSKPPAGKESAGGAAFEAKGATSKTTVAATATNKQKDVPAVATKPSKTPATPTKSETASESKGKDKTATDSKTTDPKTATPVKTEPKSDAAPASPKTATATVSKGTPESAKAKEPAPPTKAPNVTPVPTATP